MKKQLIDLSAKTLIGVSVRTKNLNEMIPAMSKIGPLVEQYWKGQFNEKIPARANPSVTYCAYTNYESNEHGMYDFFIGEETNSAEVPGGFVAITIPGGSYQKFTTEPGKIPDIVIQSWMQIWKMNKKQLGGNRCYQTDFEVYDERAADQANAVLDICIGIR